jgi:uncharacterized protein
MAAAVALNPVVERRLAQMVRRIVVRFDPEKVILFGSYARGTAGPDSDIDLLVVMPAIASKRKMMVEMLTVLDSVQFPKDVVVATPTEMRQQKHVAGTIIRAAFEEGRVVYDKHSKRNARGPSMD